MLAFHAKDMNLCHSERVRGFPLVMLRTNVALQFLALPNIQKDHTAGGWVAARKRVDSWTAQVCPIRPRKSDEDETCQGGCVGGSGHGLSRYGRAATLAHSPAALSARFASRFFSSSWHQWVGSGVGEVA